jgi:serine/threonine-protein kinase
VEVIVSEEADLVAAEQRVGRVLHDRWTLERLLGVGGTAAVYVGRHRNGARQAIKVLHAHLGRVRDVRERFLREGYAANRVEHAGVVRVLDDDVVRDSSGAETAYIVMELLEGEALADRLDRAPALSEREVLLIARGVLDVLQAAHANGVVHRDLKPDNIFLANDPNGGPPRVKVLDFGLARIAESERLTQTGQAFGTPSYMSPEQAGGRTHEIDERTDVFALGATMFRALAHRSVHSADNALAIMLKMATQPAPRLRSVAPHVSPAVAAIVDSALEFRREDRYSNAETMRADVERALAAPEDVGAKAVLAASEPTVRYGSPPQAAAEESAPLERPRRRTRIPQVTAALYVALLAGELLAPSNAPRSGTEGSRVDAVPPARPTASDVPTGSAGPRSSAVSSGSRVAPRSTVPTASQRARVPRAAP